MCDLLCGVGLQRPIAEFSLEDGKKLKMKEMRQQQVKVCLLCCLCWCVMMVKIKSNTFSCLHGFQERFKRRGPMARGKMQPQSGGRLGPQKGVSKPHSNMVTKEGSAKTQSAPSGQGRKDGGMTLYTSALTLNITHTQLINSGGTANVCHF